MFAKNRILAYFLWQMSLLTSVCEPPEQFGTSPNFRELIPIVLLNSVRRFASGFAFVAISLTSAALTSKHNYAKSFRMSIKF